MESFNPSRLDLARRRRGLTKAKLADDVGISTRMLNGYERGEHEPTTEMLARFASVLRFPATFFHGDDLEEPQTDGVSFRSLSTMTRRQRDQALGAAATSLMLDDWVRARFALPDPDVPRLPDASPEDAAESVRSAWGMGQKRAPNMVHLLEAHGVRVFSLVEECRDVDAFSFWRGDRPYVFLNGMKTAERSRMDAAHELGHLVMHAHGGPSGRAAETEAQSFGSAFLMPRRAVIAESPPAPTAKQVLHLKHHWNVSAMNLSHRLHKLSLLSDWQVRAIYIQLNELGYRNGEPDGKNHETSQIMTKVFSSLRTDGYTRAAVARELGLPVDEVNRAVFGLTIAPADRADASSRGVPTTRDPGRPPGLRVVSS